MNDVAWGGGGSLLERKRYVSEMGENASKNVELKIEQKELHD